MQISHTDLEAHYSSGIFQCIGFKEFHEYLAENVQSDEAYAQAIDLMKIVSLFASSICVGDKLVPLRDQPTVGQFRTQYRRFLIHNFKVTLGFS